MKARGALTSGRRSRTIQICGRYGVLCLESAIGPHPNHISLRRKDSERQEKSCNGKSCFFVEARTSDDCEDSGKSLEPEQAAGSIAPAAGGDHEGRCAGRDLAVSRDGIDAGQERTEGCAAQEHGEPLQEPVECAGEGCGDEEGGLGFRACLRATSFEGEGPDVRETAFGPFFVDAARLAGVERDLGVLRLGQEGISQGLKP